MGQRVGTAGPLAGLSVTVVGVYYAPDSTGVAPYTTELCETLAAAGAAVRAVVGVPHYPHWRVDPAYRFTPVRTEDRGGVAVTRVRHLVPRRHDVARRALYELTFLAGSTLAGTVLARRDRPDVVLGVTPSLAGAATAALLAARTGAALGVVVQDLVGAAAGQSGTPGGGRLAGGVGRLESAVLRRADLVAAISEGFRPPLAALGVPADRVRSLPNHTRLATTTLDRDAARRRLGWPADRPIALHTGNIGYKQDLGNVVAAAGLAAGRDDLLFVLLGDGNDRAAVRRLAGGAGNVRFVDPVPDDLYPVALAAADCLLLNERASVSTMCLPSKLTSYLAAGRPVVAATAAGGGAARLVLDSGAGVVVPPAAPAALLDAVRRVVGDAAAGAAHGARGRRYAAGHLGRAAARERAVALVAELAGRDRPAHPAADTPAPAHA